MGTQSQALRVATVLALLGLALPAGAEVAASLEAGVGYSDNIARANSGKVDETLGTVGLIVDAERAEGRLTGLFNADVEYISYLDNTYDDDVYGRVDAVGDYEFVEDLFSWRVEDSWGQIRSDPFEVTNPENVENSNYFATGPDLGFRFGPRTQMTVSGRWSETTYEKSERDYSRLGGGLGFSRGVSDRTTIGFHGYAARVEFDDTNAGSDYDAQEYYARFTTKGARTRIEVDGGYTEIHDQGESSGNPLFRLTASRDISPRTALTLTVGTEFSDAGKLFQGIGEVEGTPGFGNPSDVIAVGDPFERRYVHLDWSTEGQRGSFSLGVNYRQELYETLTYLDRDVTEVHAGFSRGLTESIGVSLDARYEMEQYDDGSYDDDRLELTAAVAWDVSRNIYLSADYEFYQSDSNSPTRNYDESRAWLRVGYRAR